MDSLTHALTGAVIGHSLGNSKMGPKAMVWGAAIANIPDLDTLLTPFFSPVDAMLFHRGFSHSILLMLIGSVILAYTLKRFSHKQYSFGFWWLFILLPWLSHLVMDIFNTYGTAILEPFSSVRVSFDSMAIIDINLLLILTLTLIILFIFRKKQQRHLRSIGIAGLVVVSLYFSLNAFIKVSLENKVMKMLTDSGIGYTRIHSTPLPLTNLIWMVVVEDSASFNVGQVNILKKQLVSQTVLPKGNDQMNCQHTLSKIKRFTKNFYTIERGNGDLVYVNDLRFSSLESSYPAAYVIRFKVDDRSCAVERAHPNRSINLKNIRQMLGEVVH